MVNRSGAPVRKLYRGWRVSPSTDLQPTEQFKVQDAAGLQRFLKEQVREKAPAQPAEEASPPRRRESGTDRVIIRRRVLKTLTGLAVVAVFGFVPLRALLQTSSVEAVINSRIVTLRAPIAGEVETSAAALTGSRVEAAGTLLLTISNVRADRSRLDDLRRQADHLAIVRTALASKLRTLESELRLLDAQVQAFRTARIEQLEAKSAELQSDIASASARRDDAAAAFDRGVTLARLGSVSRVSLTRTRRDLSVAEAAAEGARHRMIAADVELTAARSGMFVGDSYNDQPSSAQRASEVRQRASDLTADLAAADADIARLTIEATDEEARFRTESQAPIVLPASGRIWEVLTAPGEQVRVGQDLVKILDCSGAVVTSNVTESTYNRLRIGSPARFLPADGGPDLEGAIMSLTGVAGAPANLAIAPSALSKEPYRVSIAVPKLVDGQACTIGRTGRVVFDTAAAQQP